MKVLRQLVLFNIFPVGSSIYAQLGWLKVLYATSWTTEPTDSSNPTQTTQSANGESARITVETPFRTVLTKPPVEPIVAMDKVKTDPVSRFWDAFSLTISNQRQSRKLIQKHLHSSLKFASSLFRAFPIILNHSDLLLFSFHLCLFSSFSFIFIFNLFFLVNFLTDFFSCFYLWGYDAAILLSST